MVVELEKVVVECEDDGGWNSDLGRSMRGSMSGVRYIAGEQLPRRGSEVERRFVNTDLFVLAGNSSDDCGKGENHNGYGSDRSALSSFSCSGPPAYPTLVLEGVICERDLSALANPHLRRQSRRAEVSERSSRAASLGNANAWTPSC